LKVGDYTAKIQAIMVGEKKSLAAAFERLPYATMYWGMIDLAGSTNFRILHGPREGYVRGETFFSLIHSIVGPCAEVRLLKEIGDAVLLSSATFRPLFESMILIDQVTSQIADIMGTGDYPFAVRGGISFGAAKRMRRTRTDFLGSPIDILSRIMSIRSKTSNLLLHEEAYDSAGEIIKEYADVLSFSRPKKLSSTISDSMDHSIHYREVSIDRAKLIECESLFAPWQKARVR